MTGTNQILWKLGSVDLEEKEFFISDDPEGVISEFLGFVVLPDVIDKIDELFAADGDGINDAEFVHAFRIKKDNQQYQKILFENNYFDLEKDDIWLVQVVGIGEVILKGDELRYLLREAQKLWLDKYPKYKEQLKRFLWKRGSIDLDEDGFYVDNDPDRVIANFLFNILSNKTNNIEELFTADGDGYSDEFFLMAYRITEENDLPYGEWQEDNPFDLIKDEIWCIRDNKHNVAALKGDDIRYLLKQAQKLWFEREQK